MDRASGRLEHRQFHDLAQLIPPGDVLVLNTTRVTRARLLGTALGPVRRPRSSCSVHSATTGSRPSSGPVASSAPGRVVTIAPDFTIEIEQVTDRRTRIVRLRTDRPVEEAIARSGTCPSRPTSTRPDTIADADRYQTVYAREPGSVAAPTAGLHFTPPLLGALSARGVVRADLVLHVGAGTFKPVESDDPAAHVMHEEWYEVPATTADRITAAKREGRAIWAVGTTAARALESATTSDGTLLAGAAETRLFIRPPYAWRAVDRLITNFHLPRSTLLMLVAAFAGFDLTLRAYREAIEAGYRFYSYGDAMLVR